MQIITLPRIQCLEYAESPFKRLKLGRLLSAYKAGEDCTRYTYVREVAARARLQNGRIATSIKRYRLGRTNLVNLHDRASFVFWYKTAHSNTENNKPVTLGKREIITDFESSTHW